jgi:two-component system probable response regulator PhcQ
MARIMLVDDEENIIRALRRSLSTPTEDGTEVATRNTVELFTSPLDALARAEEGVLFDIVISDYRMPEMDGVAFLKALRKIQPDAVRFLLSGYADLDGLVGAINEAKIHRFIAKPWDDYALRADIHQALEFRALQLENQRLANEVRHQQGVISLQELELLRLEAEVPGITKVRRRADGGVLLDEE